MAVWLPHLGLQNRSRTAKNLQGFRLDQSKESVEHIWYLVHLFGKQRATQQPCRICVLQHTLRETLGGIRPHLRGVHHRPHKRRADKGHLGYHVFLAYSTCLLSRLNSTAAANMHFYEDTGETTSYAPAARPIATLPRRSLPGCYVVPSFPRDCNSRFGRGLNRGYGSLCRNSLPVRCSTLLGTWVCTSITGYMGTAGCVQTLCTECFMMSMHQSLG